MIGRRLLFRPFGFYLVHWPRLVAVVAVAAFLATGFVESKAETRDPADAHLSSLVKSFSKDLFGSNVRSAPCQTRLSVGIWPFKDKALPISQLAAERIYGELVGSLLATAPDCVDVMDGNGIGVVLEHLHRTGALAKAGGNPVAALEAANQSVDIVVLARIFAQNGAVMISLKGVERRSGRTVAQSPAHRLADNLTRSALADTAIGLDAAIEAAVGVFALQARDMTRLVPAGLYYQDSGAQPPFARYVMERITARLVSRWRNLLTDRALRVIEPEFDLAADLGRRLSSRDLDPLAKIASRDGSDGLYQMRGVYWPIGDAIDVTLTLKTPTGKTVSWHGRIRQADIGGLEIAPRNTDAAAPSDGGFAVLMTTKRGSNPVFRDGEELQLFIRTERTAWFHCFFIDSKGGVTQVLPNKYQKDAADGHRLEAHVLHAFPDPKRDPFAFRVDTNTTGEEMLKCIATTRNVDKDLPDILRARELSPLPGGIAAEIDTIFNQVPNTALATAAVTITTVPAR